MRLVLPLIVLAVLAAFAYSPDLAQADPIGPVAVDAPLWENLQVLSDTLTEDELDAIMNGFKTSLGVNCSHCHVRENGDFNFASDANPHKEVARGMIRMTWRINTELLPEAGTMNHHGTPTVTCNTCHRGSAHPEMDMSEMEHGEGMEHGEDAEHEHGEGMEHGEGKEHEEGR